MGSTYADAKPGYVVLKQGSWLQVVMLGGVPPYQNLAVEFKYVDANNAPQVANLTGQIGLSIVRQSCVALDPLLSQAHRLSGALQQSRAYELKDWQYRLEREFPLNQVTVFHPLGYPGRPASLATSVMIVDDVWGLVGSSTVRRRGLYYDGSTDLVFTDTFYENGICPSLARFRQLLMANRLGITPIDGNFPNPSFTRLYDGRVAFDLMQEILAQGGAGTIEPFHRVIGSVSPVDPYPCESLDAACYNPDGEEVLANQQVWTQLLLEMGLIGNP